MDSRFLRKAWKKFDRGDHLSDEEVEGLIASVNEGIVFLQDRRENGGVLYKALINRSSLLSMQNRRTANRLRLESLEDKQ